MKNGDCQRKRRYEYGLKVGLLQYEQHERDEKGNGLQYEWPETTQQTEGNDRKKEEAQTNRE